MSVSIYHPTKKIKQSIILPSSKSESNRALIINALSGNKGKLENISEARDTKILKSLLASDDYTLNARDAGTTFRFMTSLLALRGEEKYLTGNERMCERPVGILVEALKRLGADIEYAKNEGYPPLIIKGFRTEPKNQLKIEGNVSSQFISSILMIAPYFPKGLNMELIEPIYSVPYIKMTLNIMKAFGIDYSWQGNVIKIPPGEYQACTFFVESDWSAASYWYSMASIAEEAEIELKGLKQNSLQGDSAITEIMEPLGISTAFDDKKIFLRKNYNRLPDKKYLDFTNYPDLAQTLVVLCAARQVNLTITGVESLKIKETDRISALKYELLKIGIHLEQTKSPEVYELRRVPLHIPENIEFETYKDHRMAMALTPFGLLNKIKMTDPQVVEKSYPEFWNDIERAGFKVMQEEQVF